MWRHFLVDAAWRKSSKKATERTEEDMAELSLYLTNVNVSLGQTMDTEKVKSFLNIISEVMELHTLFCCRQQSRYIILLPCSLHLSLAIKLVW